MATPRNKLIAGLTGLSLAVLVLGGGCARVAEQGRTGVKATFFVHTLWAEIDRSVRPTDVQAAARKSMAEQGMSVFKDRVSAATSELAGQEPGDRWPKRIVIESRDTGASTLVWLTMRPRGDEVALRTLLDAMLRQLGV
ncbi:MAG: hypothetical protein AAF108_11790 [Planctomycetota bacterium]